MRKLTLALIAHDAKKDDMVMLVRAHAKELAELELVATKGTGQLVAARTGLEITLLEDGPYGGDQQIGAKVASGEIQAVVFLRDPLMAKPHEPDVATLLRVCDVHNVPVATNLATAEAILDQVAEYPEILGRHHMLVQCIHDMASLRD